MERIKPCLSICVWTIFPFHHALHFLHVLHFCFFGGRFSAYGSRLRLLSWERIWPSRPFWPLRPVGHRELRRLPPPHCLMICPECGCNIPMAMSQESRE